MSVRAYVATVGEYSEYAIRRVFLDEELAEQYRTDGYCDAIEVFEVTDEPVASEELLTMRWAVTQASPTRHTFADESAYTERVEMGMHPQCASQVQNCEAGYPGLPGPHVIVTVSGLDHERVRQVYDEQVAAARLRLNELNPAGAE